VYGGYIDEVVYGGETEETFEILENFGINTELTD
jgi:hypothetical protein